jgi:phosphatidylserine decarboxylase
MAAARHPILAREGWVDIIVLASAGVAINYFAGWLWALPVWVALAFVTQFFRDPTRKIPAEPLGIICPADGRVVSVGDIHDPYLDRESRRVSIFMNVFNVHSNYSPTEGIVKERWYNPGRFFNAALDKAAKENERNALWIQTDEGDDIVVVQVAGLIARRILCYKQPGERIGQGERFGFIRYGSRVDIYLPPDTEIRVSLGDKVKAGSDVVATLKR